MIKPNRHVILRRLNWQKQSKVEKLIINIDILMGTLAVARKRLEAEGKVDNSLGIIQYKGIEIDRMCGEIATLQGAIDLVDGKE